MRRRLIWISAAVLGLGLLTALTWWTVAPRSPVTLAGYDAVQFGLSPADAATVLGPPMTEAAKQAARADLSQRIVRGDAMVFVNVKEDWQAGQRGFEDASVVWANGADSLTVFFRDGQAVGKVFTTLQTPSFLDRVRRVLGL